MKSHQISAQGELLRLRREDGLRKRLAGIWGAKLRLKQLLNKKSENRNNSFAILRYEHVVDPRKAEFPLLQSNYTTPKTLDSHLNYLKANCNVISLADLMTSLNKKTPLPPRTVSITFDGGYKNQYHSALPLLKRHSLPATFFVYTSFIGAKSLPWDLELLHILLFFKIHNMPIPQFQKLNHLFSNSPLPFPRGKVINDTHILQLLDALRVADNSNKLQLLNHFRAQAQSLGELPELDIFMRWNDLRECLQNNIKLAIGGHSSLPYPLSSLHNQRMDLKNSLLAFKQHALTPLPFFAFPDASITEDSFEHLSSLGVSHFFTIGDEVSFKLDTDPLRAHGRVSIHEEATYLLDYFILRMWGLSVDGYVF